MRNGLKSSTVNSEATGSQPLSLTEEKTDRVQTGKEEVKKTTEKVDIEPEKCCSGGEQGCSREREEITGREEKRLNRPRLQQCVG